MATHFSILAGEILVGFRSSQGYKRVGDNLVNKHHHQIDR